MFKSAVRHRSKILFPLPLFGVILLVVCSPLLGVSPIASFYGGVQWGYNHSPVQVTHSHTWSTVDIAALGGPLVPEPPSLMQEKFHCGRLQRGFVAGVDWRLCPKKIVLGIQVVGELDQGSRQMLFQYNMLDSYNPIKQDIRVNVKRSFSLIPGMTIGYMVHPRVRFFATMGFGVTRFGVRVENSIGNGVSLSGLVFKKQLTKTVWSPSLGMEIYFSHCLSGMGSFGLTQTAFQTRFPSLCTDDFIFRGASNPSYQKFKYRHFNVSFGILYRFGKKSDPQRETAGGCTGK